MQLQETGRALPTLKGWMHVLKMEEKKDRRSEVRFGLMTAIRFAQIAVIAVMGTCSIVFSRHAGRC